MNNYKSLLLFLFDLSSRFSIHCFILLKFQSSHSIIYFLHSLPLPRADDKSQQFAGRVQKKTQNNPFPAGNVPFPVNDQSPPLNSEEIVAGNLETDAELVSYAFSSIFCEKLIKLQYFPTAKLRSDSTQWRIKTVFRILFTINLWYEIRHYSDQTAYQNPLSSLRRASLEAPGILEVTISAGT